jgi:hypothetical protein
MSDSLAIITKRSEQYKLAARAKFFHHGGKEDTETTLDAEIAKIAA